jgi:hypothetical protein
MLKNILPKILHDTKFKKISKCINYCSYDYDTDLVSFNRTEIKKEHDINKNICLYLGKNLKQSDIVLISLLHELGHRYRYLTKISQPYEDYKKEVNLYGKMYNYKHSPAYFLLITEEREAMKLAYKWFKDYKKCQRKR